MTTAKYQRIVVFLNPASGALDPDLRSQVRDRLAAISGSLEEVTVNPDVKLLDRAAEAVREGATLIVVAGGDGTVREIASALVGTEVPLAIVPLGTFNNLALSLNLPCNPQAACDLIEAGFTRRIDVGVADDRNYFFEAAGVGVDADLFPIGEEVKSGRFHSVLQGIGLALSHAQTPVRLQFDRPVEDA